MTPTGYFFAKALNALGLARIEKRRTAAAFETHLLADSEQIIGEFVWESLENIEEVSTEYWKLRKLRIKQNELETKAEKLAQILDNTQEQRTQDLEQVSEGSHGMVSEHSKITESIKRLNQEKEDLLREGRAIKRTHRGLKTKLEVLLEESGEESKSVVESTRNQLKEKRIKFEKIREQASALDSNLSEQQLKLTELNKKIKEANSGVRKNAEQQFSVIGKTNKELTNIRGKQGLIKSKQLELYCSIGKFVLCNGKDPEIKKATKRQKQLLSLIEEVRKSSLRHHKLLGT